MFSSADETYFYEQTNNKRYGKRHRKTADELPQSLRYAHMNPKIASFYKDKSDDEGGLPDYLQDDAGKETVLPDITLTFSNIRNQLLSGVIEDYDVNRTILTERKSVAPSLLDQLAKLLPIVQITKRRLLLPRSLEISLQSSYEDLVYDARYVKREWQVIDNQIQHNMSVQERQSRESEIQTNTAASGKISKIKHEHSDSEDEIKQPNTEVEPSRPTTKSRRRGLGRLTQSQPVINVDGPPPKSRGGDGVKRNRSDSALKKPGTAPTGKLIPDSNRLAVIRAGAGDEISEDAASMKSHVPPQPYSLQVLSFNLANYETWEDKGCHVFCVDKDNSNDHPLEWVVKRLNRASKTIMESGSRDAVCNNTELAYTRYYDQIFSEKQLAKSVSEKIGVFNTVIKGGKPKIPKIKKEKGKTFVTQIADGSKVIYYETGEVGAISSFSGDKGYHTICYADTELHDLILNFTPSGAGFAENIDNQSTLLVTDKGLSMAHSEDFIETIKWPDNAGSKLNQPVIFELSKHMYVKIFSRYSITLSVTPLLNHNIKLNIGRTEGVTPPELDAMLPMKNLDLEFTSSTALELIQKSRKMSEKEKPQKRGVKTPKGKESSMRNVEFAEQSVLMLDFSKIEKDFSRLKNKAKILVDDWMDIYRIAIGIAPPPMKSLKLNNKWRPGVVSAKSSPPDGEDYNADDLATSPIPISVTQFDGSSRVVSAPSGYSLVRRSQTARATQLSSTDITLAEDSVSIHTARDSRIFPASARVSGVALQSPRHTQLPVPRTTGLLTSVEVPRLQGLMSEWTMANHYQCAAALRQQLLGRVFHEKINKRSSHVCKCHRRQVPYITDVEMETFIRVIVPTKQLVVIAVVSSSLLTEADEVIDMLDKLHSERCANRTHVCMQSKADPYRIYKYDVCTSFIDSEHAQPLLTLQHNAVPGMFLIFQGGKLVFCDHIFNGYGNAKRDFQKQLVDCRRMALRGFCLPPDFKFSPARGRRGPRSPWGGEIGGVSRRGLTLNRGLAVNTPAIDKIGNESPDDEGSVSSLEYHISQNTRSFGQDYSTSKSMIRTLNRRFQKSVSNTAA